MIRKDKAIIAGLITAMFFTATAISASGNEVPQQESATTTTETKKSVLNSLSSLETTTTTPVTTEVTNSTYVTTTIATVKTTMPASTTKITTTEATTTQTTETTTTTATTTTSTTVIDDYYWDGPVLNSFSGKISGPSGTETYYNLNMSGVIRAMQKLGYDYEYWVREDGVKMFGEFVMCAADLSIRPKGTIVDTSLGKGIVCDTGGFVKWDSTRLDIATTW